MKGQKKISSDALRDQIKQHRKSKRELGTRGHGRTGWGPGSRLQPDPDLAVAAI